jgi:hypothetical protein
MEEKNTVEANFKVLSQHFPGGNEKTGLLIDILTDDLSRMKEWQFDFPQNTALEKPEADF